MAKTVKAAKRSTHKKVVAAANTLPFPNYWVLTKEVFSQLKQSQKIILRFIGLLSAIVIVLTFSSQQAAYMEQVSEIRAVSSEISSGLTAKFLETGVLFVTLLSGTLTANIPESQQLSLSLVYLLAWLIMVWFMRHFIAEKKVNVRDGLYNATAPLISTMLIVLVAAVQLIPLAILTSILSAVASTGSVNGILILVGVLLIIVMAVVTLYWLVGTLFGVVIVAIPGTYPIAALKSARAIVAGKRALILSRLLWLGFVNLTANVVVVMPILLIDALSGYALSWITIGISIVLSLCQFVFSSAYLYLLYRRIIDERTV